MIAECMVYVKSETPNTPDGEKTIEIASSSSLDVANTIPILFDNIKTQAAFGHLEHITGKEKGWTLYYSDTDQVREDISTQISVKILRYIFAYPEDKGFFKYKRINVKGKAYIQRFKKYNDRYFFDTRFPVKGLATETRRKIELAEEL